MINVNKEKSVEIASLLTKSVLSDEQYKEILNEIPNLFVPEIKKGDYLEFNSGGRFKSTDVVKVVKVTKDQYDDIAWISHLPTSVSGGGFRYGGNGYKYGKDFIRIDKSEIGKYILKEAVQRGYTSNNYFIQSADDTFTPMPYGNECSYNEESDALYIGNIKIYENGKWEKLYKISVYER